MNSQGRRFAWIGAALAVFLLVGATRTGRTVTEALGAAVVFVTHESYRLPTGLTARGKVGKPREIVEARSHVFLPGHEGRVIEISTVGENAVFWLQDGEGRIRNVVLEGIDRMLYLVESRPTEVHATRRTRPGVRVR